MPLFWDALKVSIDHLSGQWGLPVQLIPRRFATVSALVVVVTVVCAVRVVSSFVIFCSFLLFLLFHIISLYSLLVFNVSRYFRHFCYFTISVNVSCYVLPCLACSSRHQN